MNQSLISSPTRDSRSGRLDATEETRKVLEELGIGAVPSGVYAGRWITEPTGKELATVSPIDGNVIARVRQAGATDYQQVMTAALKAFDTWRVRPAPQRGEVVRQIGETLRRHKSALGRLVSLEMGKLAAEGEGEIQEMIDIADFAMGLSRQLYGLTMHSERSRHRMYEQWHPLGVLGLITSFNFPAAVWAWNSAIAAVCGDTVVWKPSSSAPLTAIAIQHLVQPVLARNDAQGVLNLCVGPGSMVGEQLIGDGRVPLVSMTGSTAMGRHIAQVVAARLGRSILELGGNNAIIVAADANLELAVQSVLFGAIGTAGQRCTSTRRVLLERPIAADFTARLLAAYRTVRIGNPLDPTNLMGPLVDREATETLIRAVAEAQRQGGELLYGGRRLSGVGFEGGCYLEPAIVRAPADLPMMQEETFGPLLYLVEVADVEEAIRVQNGVPQGLSSAIFTERFNTAERFLAASGSDCGIANVNLGTSGAEIGGAFGGEKDTGGGRESGSDAWKAYMRRQTNTLNWGGDLKLAQGLRFGE
jgi:aldehyde dehydrogenase (NAD+)